MDNTSRGARTGSSSIHPWHPPRRARPPARSKLRNGTWIIPGTGERTRRQFTLRHPDLNGTAAAADHDDDDAPSPPEHPTAAARLRAAVRRATACACLFWAWLKSPKGRGTLKCSIAYLIASMGTFYPPFARFLGPLDGKHIVATIVTYFHPARTAGSQIESVAIAIIGVCYALLIGTLSMATSVLVGSVWEQVRLSYALIVVVFIGGGMGFIGWVKQKLNNPLVGVGASIASIGIITIITKETSVHSGVFTNHKIIQSLKILMMATTISTAVNILLWPVSARIALRGTMRTASVSLGDMLSMITKGFLSGAEEDLSGLGFAQTSASFRSTLTTMNKHLRESKYEYYALGRERIYQHDKAVVRCMEKLAQSLGGLRSAADTQFELLKEKASTVAGSQPMSPMTNPLSPPLGRPSSQLKSGPKFAVLSAIDEAPDERIESDPPTPFFEIPPPSPLPPGVYRHPSDIFEIFIQRLGPALKSLVHTLSEILRDPPFGAPGSPITINENFKHSTNEALMLFNAQRAKALEEVYKTIEMERARPENVQADYEEVAAACGHFAFSLLSLGDEMEKYLEALEDLKMVTERNRRSWNFLRLWRYLMPARKRAGKDPEEQPLVPPARPVPVLRRSVMPKGIPDNITRRRDSFSWDAAPQASAVLRWMSQRLLRFFRFLSRDDIRFGLKVGIGASLYAMFAFIPETRPIYQHWRGEWGLLSFMIVCSMTVGASNTTGLSRFTGTVMGACFVVFNWWITGGEPISLALLGWLVSFGTFYIMVDRGNGPFGRFILLSYNVSSLYAYSLTQKVDDDDDDEGGTDPLIQQIAFHRVVAVSIGILWGLVVCRLIWPISARRKFKEGLSMLYLQMGIIWKRGPLAILLQSDATDSYMKLGEQAAMQRYASQLQTLCTAAGNEYELRGPFPEAAYRRILGPTQRLLDAFHAMSLVTLKHGRLSDGEKALLYHTADERAQLCSRICHVFQVLASSVMLEYPLTDAIPSVEGTRDKLLGKIFRFRKEHNVAWNTAEVTSLGDENNNNYDPTGRTNGKSAVPGVTVNVPKLGNVNVEEPDYALLYAYALVTGQVANELKTVEREVEALFGKLNDDTLLLQ